METNKFDYSMLMDKITEYAKKAGRTSVKPMLLMYYVLKSPDTPTSEKIMIYSAIAYVVLPIDLISARRLPIIGWIDEVVSLTVAYQKIKRHITPAMEFEADALLDKWFPSYTSYEVIE
jgi:uncharacterized membrane protein YkvA (DUF1232 family)